MGRGGVRLPTTESPGGRQTPQTQTRPHSVTVVAIPLLHGRVVTIIEQSGDPRYVVEKDGREEGYSVCLFHSETTSPDPYSLRPLHPPEQGPRHRPLDAPPTNLRPNVYTNVSERILTHPTIVHFCESCTNIFEYVRSTVQVHKNVSSGVRLYEGS